MEKCIYSHSHFSQFQLTVSLCHQLLVFGMAGSFSVVLMDVFMNLPIKYDLYVFDNNNGCF